MNIAEAVVLNLPRRVDRREMFLARYEAAGLGRIPLRIHGATDERLTKPPSPAWAKFPRGAWGCWNSHIQALNASRGPVLVFEDDAVFSPHLADYLAVVGYPDGWELIHLGGRHITPPQPVYPGLVRPRRLLGSHAYLAHYPGVLAAGLRAHRTHVDYALAALRLDRYAVAPWLVGQDDSPGDITRLAPQGIDFWQEE